MRVTFVFERGSDREICPIVQHELSPSAQAFPSDPAREIARPGENGVRFNYNDHSWPDADYSLR